MPTLIPGQTLKLALLLALAIASSAQAPTRPPNVLLIVADDLGHSDLGCQGGEIATPNLDALAAQGLQFAQFYDAGRCWPSRAAMLTGYYAQAIRRDRVPGVASGASGKRPKWAPLLPELLRPHGYRSYHSGKWHLDGEPLISGFDRSYSLDDHDRHFGPQQHREDGARLPAVAAEPNGYYSSTAIVDRAIDQLREHARKHTGQPFFAFVAFTAPHFPLQAPAADIARYADAYDRGWDLLRVERWQRLRALGLGGTALAAVERDVGPPYDFPAALQALGPFEVNRAVAWRDLDADCRRFQAAKMAVHAAMVDRMDQEIGRLLEQLRAMQAEADTLVCFLSDNGASAEIMVRGDGHELAAPAGSRKSYLSLGPGWSSLANTPFRRHKTWTHEGGIATPMLVRWPQGIAARGELRHAAAHVVDLVPTILELAGGARDDAAPPWHGISLLPTFAGDVALVRDGLWWQHEGNRAFRRGNWKIVAAGATSAWELYDLAADRSETENLAAEMPDKARELAAAWQAQSDACGELARRDLPEGGRAGK